MRFIANKISVSSGHRGHARRLANPNQLSAAVSDSVAGYIYCPGAGRRQAQGQGNANYFSQINGQSRRWRACGWTCKRFIYDGIIIFLLKAKNNFIYERNCSLCLW